MVGFISYLLVKGDVYWILVLATSIGSIVAAPLAALTVRKVNAEKLRVAIGLAIIILGSSTLAKTFIF